MREEEAEEEVEISEEDCLNRLVKCVGNMAIQLLFVLRDLTVCLQDIMMVVPLLQPKTAVTGVLPMLLPQRLLLTQIGWLIV